MIAVVAALAAKEGRLLIAQRPMGRHMGGKWEFPGGKLEKGETPEAALRRELNEELGVDADIARSARRFPSATRRRTCFCYSMLRVSWASRSPSTRRRSHG